MALCTSVLWGSVEGSHHDIFGNTVPTFAYCATVHSAKKEYRTLCLDKAQNTFKLYTLLNVHFFLILHCEATAATPGLLCQPRVIMKMIVEKQMECRLAGGTEVLGENLPQCHFCPQNPT
jgi:hypothetical protein